MRTATWPFPFLDYSMETDRYPWGWSAKRRARQSAAIHSWSPWRFSTGPTSVAGKAITSKNALKPSPIRHELIAMQAELAEVLRQVKRVAATRRP
jgi:hypothetical protein